MVRQALGKGLGALIPSKNEIEAIEQIDIQKIIKNPQQPRKHFESDKLEDLVVSVKKHGIIQPVIARKKGDQYELIAGERRLRAAELAGFSTVPAVIKTASDEKSLEIALIENIQRENLNPMEEAYAYAELINEFGLTQDDVSEQVGKNRSTVTNTLRLLKLPIQIQQWIEKGTLSRGHAKAILGLSASPVQMKIAQEIVEKGLSVREVEDKIRKLKDTSSSQKKETIDQKDPYVNALEEKLKSHFSTMVKLKDTGNHGKMVIEYYSREELQNILEKIGVNL